MRGACAQVFYGCTRYKKLLKIFISSLYFKHAGETQRADQTLYTVLAYLALLRLSELGFADFRALVLSQEHFKMTVFLRFLFDEENLRTWLRPEWTKHYEPSFVEEQLIDRIGTFIPQARTPPTHLLGTPASARAAPRRHRVRETPGAPQVHALEKVLAGRMASEAAKKEAAAEAARALAEGRGGSHKHTTPEPFDLTAPKPRLVPVPADEIDCTFKAGGVPASTYADAKQLKDRIALDKQKDANRVRMKAKYSDPRVQPFKLRVTERPSNLPRIKAEVEAARDAECTFDPPAAKPVPKPREGAGVVKLNSAAILREDNLYRKKQQSEAQLLGAYEQELRDSSEFDAWQARMRTADEESRMKEVERRRVETLLADEEAKEARLRKLNENRALAAALKVEHGENERKRAAAAAELHEAQRAIVTDVQSQRDNPKVAAEEVARENRARAADLRQDMEARAAAAAEERRIEDERRQDLIKQIRALELVPRERVTILDPTYTPQLGLLEEMSLAELRERLRMAEVERAEEEQLKRAKIVAAMQEKEEDLAARMERLKEMRELAAKQASAKRDAAAQEQAAVESARRERLAEAQLEVHTKIEAKRASRRKEEEKLAEELKRIRIKNSFLGANKARSPPRYSPRSAQRGPAPRTDPRKGLAETAAGTPLSRTPPPFSPRHAGGGGAEEVGVCRERREPRARSAAGRRAGEGGEGGGAGRGAAEAAAAQRAARARGARGGAP